MIKKRTIVISALLFIVAYVLLLLPQLNANRAYAEFFCWLGNRLYENVAQDGFVRLSTQTDQGKNDIVLFISRSDWIKDGKLMGVEINKASDRIGYLITAFFLALALATPMNWKRKIFAVLLGLTLMTVFVMLKLYIIILHSYTLVDWFGLYQEAAEKERIQFWYNYFAAPATYGYSFAVIVWLAVSIGRKEWELLNNYLATRTSFAGNDIADH